MRFIKKEQGFTLVEIMVAIAIIAILMAIAVPSYLKQREKGDLLDIQGALTNARTSLVEAQFKNRGILPAPLPNNALPAGITTPDNVSIKYWANSTKICLSGTKKNLTRYLDTKSIKISTASCTTLVN